MSYSKTIYGVFIISAILSSCRHNTASSDLTPSISQYVNYMPSDSLKTGGLYLLRGEDSLYYVVKILLMDSVAAHIRIYGHRFAKKPKRVNSAELGVLNSHVPIDKMKFTYEQPVLLKIEKVEDFELEGYMRYLRQLDK